MWCSRVRHYYRHHHRCHEGNQVLVHHHYLHRRDRRCGRHRDCRRDLYGLFYDASQVLEGHRGRWHRECYRDHAGALRWVIVQDVCLCVCGGGERGEREMLNCGTSSVRSWSIKWLAYTPPGDSLPKPSPMVVRKQFL